MERLKVKIKKLHEDAVVPYKAYPNDFCYDCVAVSEEEIAPNVWKYGLGLAFQIERGFVKPECGLAVIGDRKGDYEEKVVFSAKTDLRESHVNLSIDARPRSSVWKTGMILSNCEGTIDENYIGEVSVVFYHVMPNMPRYKVGQKVCQIKLGCSSPMDFVEVDDLSETDRGDGGYGSTGM